MILNKKDMELFEGEVLEDLSREDLMDTILGFLQSIFNYNSVVDKSMQIDILETFLPYRNVEGDGEKIGYDGVVLDNVKTEDLKTLTVDAFMIYLSAVNGMNSNPLLPLMLDDAHGIQVITHSVC